MIYSRTGSRFYSVGFLRFAVFRLSIGLRWWWRFGVLGGPQASVSTSTSTRIRVLKRDLKFKVDFCAGGRI